MKYASSITLLIAVVLPLISLIAFLIQPVDIRAAVNTTVMEVNISEVAQFEVSPTELSWIQLAPGSNGTIKNITVKNTGSTSFTSGVYMSVDSYFNGTPNPTIGTSADAYKAGSFLVAGNSTHHASDEWWFVNQVSWNETTDPITAGYSGWSTSATSWGFFHNKSDSWLWELTKSGDGTCHNGTDGSFKVVSTVNSKDLSATDSGAFASNKSGWGLWSFGAGVFKDYCVVSYTNCNYIMVYKFDMNTTLATCTNDTQILSGTLSPGVSKMFYVKPHIPSGVPAGTVTNSTVTITAT